MKRLARVLFFATLGIVVFVCALGVGLVVHLRLAIVRQALVEQVDGVLASTFAGRIHIDRLDAIGFGGLRAHRVEVFDPDGVRVIAADGVDVKLSVLDLARAELVGDALVIDDVHIDAVDVSLDTTPVGMRIARAFAPRNPTPSNPAQPSSFALAIHDIAIEHAWVHGVVSDQIVDADVDRIGGSLSVAPAGVEVDVRGADVVTRAMPRGANPRGHVEGRLVDLAQLHAFATFGGDVGGIALRAAARMDDDAFVARARVPVTSPERIRALAGDIPLYESVSADATAEGNTSAFVFHAHATAGPGTVDALGRYDHGAFRARASARHVDLRAVAPSLGRSDVGADAVVDVRDGVTRARGHVDPPGGHATFTAELDDHGADGEITASLWNVHAALAPVIGKTKLAGHGAMYARAHLDRDASAISGVTWARFEDVAASPGSIGVLDVRGHAAGALADPAVEVDVLAERTVVPRLNVSSGLVRARGHLHDARVVARLNASGPFDLSARVVTSATGAIDVDDLLVLSDRARILEGELGWDHGRARARLIGRNIDLAQVRTTLGVDMPLDGKIGVDIDASMDDRTVTGHVALDARGVDYDRFHGLDARVEASSLDGTLSLVTRARMRDVGWLSVESVDLRPRGAPLDRASWTHATGSVHVDASGNLAAIEALVDPDSHTVAGFGQVSVVARRATPTSEPDVTVTASTQKLTITEHAYDLDLSASAHLDAKGALGIHANVGRGVDTVAIDGRTNLSWNDLMAGKTPDPSTLPFTADVTMPAHDAASLCHNLAIRCHGTVEIVGHVDGPIRSARAKLAMKLTAFRSPASPFGEPVDATIDGTFDGLEGKATLAVSHAGAAHALDATVALHVPLGDWAAWYASAEAHMKDVSLRAPPEYVDDTMTARVSGTASITDIHRDARARAEIDVTQLVVDNVQTDRAKLTATFDGSKLTLAAQLASADGTLDAHADAAAKWGSHLTPALDVTSPVSLAVRANRFRLRTFMPFVPVSAGEIDGRLDADASGTFAMAPSRFALKGWAKVTDGSVQSSNFGELRDIQAKVAMQPDGSFTLEDAHVRGTTGLVKLTGHAHTSGGLVDEVKVSATIARGDKFPLVVSGQSIGDAWGRVDVTLRPKNSGVGVDLDVPSLHVVLPDQDQHDLQDLSAAKSIKIGVRDRKGEIAPVPLAPPSPTPTPSTPITIAVNLGDDVEIERGDMLKVRLTGRPVVRIAETTTMSGQIRLVRGTLDVQGKRFEIERGFVTFTGEPSNPTLSVTAAWDAPDGSRVFADYIGTVKDGKLNLHSDPPHTQDEIVALLVFGSANGPTPSTGAQSGDVTGKAVSAGASFATQPFNKALAQLTHVDIKTRVDTSGAAAKSEVEVQIAKSISAQVAYVLGLPPPGTDPDRTYLTLAWHATARWSFDFTIGDHGSTIVDALWHFRY